MKAKIIEFVQKHIPVILMIGVLLIAAGAFSFEAYRAQKKLDGDVSNRRNEANKAVQESQNSSAAAANFSIERRAEDAVREKVITPKLGEARRRSTNSKLELETVKKQYEIKKFDTENLTDSDIDNCRNLAELFPNVRFENCH